MALLPQVDYFTIGIVFGAVAVLGSLFAYLFSKPPFPKNAPPLTKETFPILGSLQFFTQTWDFFQKSQAHSKTGNFSFYAGQWPVVALSGEYGRKVFLDSKELRLSEGYSTLFGAGPKVERGKDGPESDASSFGAYFNKRLVNMLKGNRLEQGLPLMLKDVRANFDTLAKDPSGVTDPFDTIYRMVFQLTMRAVACNEIADDSPLLAKTLGLYESVASAATPFTIMFPWMPLYPTLKRTYAGAQLYMIFKRVVDARNAEGRREDDALQYLMDQGDNITDIIKFVIGALFAGLVNSGVNAAWILVYLVSKPYWWHRVTEEVVNVAAKYCPDDSLPLKERLMNVPIEAWEGEFPLIDLCLKDSIRLQSSGVAYRLNVSDHDVPINKESTEVVPKGYFAALTISGFHYDPDIYKNPEEWDPARYLPERAEDKKREYAYVGWGLGRHPCLGMRFAKLENTLIVAFFIAYFSDVKLLDANRKETTQVPLTKKGGLMAHKPDDKVYLKYKVNA